MMDIEEVLNTRLSPEQAAAVRDPARDVLSLACAGSGKSRTLAFRIAYLVAARGARPDSIVAFTFTEKAADTIKRRVAEALQAVDRDPAMLGAMYIGTIHAFCQKILGEMDARYRQFEVLDENRLKLFLISRYSDLGVVNVRRARSAGRESRVGYFDTLKGVGDAWMLVNDELLDLEAVAAADSDLGAVLRSLGERMDGDRFIDFSRMIRLVVEALRRGEGRASETVSRLRHLLVDEYQDVNPAQEALIRGLRELGATLFVVGDDDQAIYAWRGADVGNILDFQDRYGAVRHTLAYNYRSTEPIVSAADGFAAAELGPARFTKNPAAVNPDGPRDLQRLWFDTRAEEAAWVVDRIAQLLGTGYVERDGQARGLTPGDVAVLMRSTRGEEQDGSSRHGSFTRALQSRGIPFSLEAGGGPFERPQVQALVESFKLLRNKQSSREEAERTFRRFVLPGFSQADLARYTSVLAHWGREIHTPVLKGMTRRRVFPQGLVHQLLNAFGIQTAGLTDEQMRDVGLFSRIIQDVEAVYLSVDSAGRFKEILNFLEVAAARGYDTSTDDVVTRPDAVTVTTVHKAKGLEFPVVFLVDLEQSRFPGTWGYKGLIPRTVIQAALIRGAYQTTPEGEARLFYTALTRAERYLYLTGSKRLPGASGERKQSTFVLRLAHPELREDGALPAGLAPAASRRRIEDSDLPTSFSEIRYYLLCPRDYQFRRRYGFSPPIPELFGFGQTVHTSIGRMHQLYRTAAPSGAQAEDLAREVFHLKHVAPSGEPETRPGPYERACDTAARIARSYADSFGADFTRERQVEARFEVPLDGAVISGSIDLLLREDDQGRILDARVIDFKAMEGGDAESDVGVIDWTALALQVQLYALGARQVLGEETRTGAVHFLKDNHRVEVPVDEEAVRAAVQNVEWAVARILASDFPARPSPTKCKTCDFRLLCTQQRGEFAVEETPPPIHVPGGRTMAPIFSDVE